MRIRSFPFDTPVLEFLKAHETLFVVEQNLGAQLRALLTIETGFPRDRMMSLLDYGGLPLTAGFVVSSVLGHFEAAGHVAVASAGNGNSPNGAAAAASATDSGSTR
jgi:2-oxoglutarate/2-oxoacid ferredoxin oxidoreductase subunit alpha